MRRGDAQLSPSLEILWLGSRDPLHDAHSDPGVMPPVRQLCPQNVNGSVRVEVTGRA
jgi:hypothetical protein